MKKDAYYFSHDSNSKDDPKCVMLIEQLGLEGYGIFWVLVETLRDQPGYKYPLSLLPAIARKYNSTAQKVETVVKNYNLFLFTDDEFFFSSSLMERMEYLEYKRQLASIAGKKSAEKRKQLQLPFNDRSTDVQPTCNDRSTSKVKESKLNESKLNESKEDISLFDSDEYKLSIYLWNYIKNNNKDAKQPNLEKWSKQFDSIIRIDKRKIEDVEKIIKFCQQDEFWYKNILSPDKLRKHFEKLTLQMKEPKYSKSKKSSQWEIEGSDYAANNNINDLEKKLLGWSNE